MEYCVLKNTATIIDGSENPRDIMIQNAKNLGFSENDIEILTEEEYTSRKASEPVVPQLPSIDERIDMLENMILLMMEG